jgi:hypothetical protein
METYFDGEQLRAARDRRPAAHGGAFRSADLDRAVEGAARRDSQRLALILAGCCLYLLGVASGALVRVLF